MNLPKKSRLVRKRGTTFWGKAVLLYLFWLMLSWEFDDQHLWLGAVIVFLVTSFSGNFLLNPKERPHINWIDLYYIILFIVTLFWEMVKANIKVAYIVLHPNMPISPGMIRIKTHLQTDLGKVILANAITLTPGTLSVELAGDSLLIHGLTRGDLEGVSEHPLERILLKIEEG